MARLETVTVPDIGNFGKVDVIDILVAPGDTVAEEQSLISLESDKATMDVPSPFAGKVKEIAVKNGAKVGKGDVILTLEVEEGAGKATKAEATSPLPPGEGQGEGGKPPSPPAPAPLTPTLSRRERETSAPPTAPPPIDESSFARAYASPAIRKFARELGVDLGKVKGSGRGGRIVQTDVQAFVKSALARPQGATGFSLPEMPAIDFAKFGAIERQPLSRIRKLTGQNTHRSWVTVPHVTQFDKADITDLEAFRKAQAPAAQEQGVKLTLLAFLLKASAAVLRDHPRFASSLEPGGETLVLKKYVHIGIAVDTPDGLVVPVVRDVDKKGLLQIAREIADTSQRARDKKLKLDEMSGGAFTISSLGGIGGTAFTPIVNAPEVAILGVSRSAMEPVWRDGMFQARLVLPLALSYDHRVIDGAEAARFIVDLSARLADVRTLAL
jgi:pyruvate dehydrogenase E2 component (dihydrolipoamide acetyltransferase)